MWISILGSIVLLSACQRRKSKQPRCWESSWYFALPMPIEAESPIVKPYISSHTHVYICIPIVNIYCQCQLRLNRPLSNPTYHHTHMYIYICIYIYIKYIKLLYLVMYSYSFLVMYIYIIFIKHLSPDPLTNHRFVRLRKYWTLLLEVAAVFAWIYFCTTGALDEGNGRRGRRGRQRATGKEGKEGKDGKDEMRCLVC